MVWISSSDIFGCWSVIFLSTCKTLISEYCAPRISRQRSGLRYTIQPIVFINISGHDAFPFISKHHFLQYSISQFSLYFSVKLKPPSPISGRRLLVVSFQVRQPAIIAPSFFKWRLTLDPQLCVPAFQQVCYYRLIQFSISIVKLPQVSTFVKHISQYFSLFILL